MIKGARGKSEMNRFLLISGIMLLLFSLANIFLPQYFNVGLFIGVGLIWTIYGIFEKGEVKG